MSVQELISLLQNCRPDAVVLIPGELNCLTPACVRPTESVKLDDDRSGEPFSDDPDDVHEYLAQGREVLPAVVLDVQLDDPYKQAREDWETGRLKADKG